MQRYKRQIQLPQVGESGQQKLKTAKVLVVGAGGLGCAILPYLAASGIGTIGIIDGDTIEESNLQRQILYSEKTVNQNKVVIAKEHLKQLNSDIRVKAYGHYLSGSNALKTFEPYDIIVDATDNLQTRYLINDACVIANKPFVYGSVYRFEGQVSVFNYENGPTYRCLFEENNTKAPNCETSGVLGTTVGFIGMVQANEVIKMILEIGDVLSGKLLIYNTLNNSQNCIQFSKNEAINIDEAFFKSQYDRDEISEISFDEALFKNLTLLDVREYDELPEIDLPNTMQLPLSVLEENLDGLDKNSGYAVYCQSGKRSLQAVKILKQNKFKNVVNVVGGVNTFQKNKKDEKSIY